MPKYIVYTDEKITVWQRVGLVIEAESERELDEIMNIAIVTGKPNT